MVGTLTQVRSKAVSHLQESLDPSCEILQGGDNKL